MNPCPNCNKPTKWGRMCKKCKGLAFGARIVYGLKQRLKLKEQSK